MATEAAAPAPAPAPAPGVSKKLIIIMALSLVLSVGAAVGVTLALTGGSEEAAAAADGEATAEEAEPKEAHYFSIDPKFVVNFQAEGTRARFLQIEIDAVTYSEEKLQEVAKHMPVIRNGLVMLFSKQTYDGLLPPEGKDQLRADALSEIQRLLEERTGDKIVEDVFFTSFVMQ